MWQQGYEWNFIVWWRSLSILGKWVFLLLLIMFCEALFVLLERTWKLRRELKQAPPLRALLDRTIGARTIAEAISGATAMRDSLLAKLASVGLATYQSIPDRFTNSEAINFAQRAMNRQGALATAEMRIGRSTLATIGYLAPFVGLVGTMFGILNSFGGGGESRQSFMAALANSIASALLPTATGLAEGVLAIWFYNRVTRWMEALARAADDTMFQVFVFLQAHVDNRSRENYDSEIPRAAACLSSTDGSREWEARFDRFRALRISIGLSSGLVWFFLFLAMVLGLIEYFTHRVG
jgi:biopolymer transport protein ExbB/TolQ